MSREDKIVLLAAATLALVLVAVIGVLLAGLFSAHVDNDKLFAILGPAFQTIVGCFVGILGSLAVTKMRKSDEEK